MSGEGRVEELQIQRGKWRMSQGERAPIIRIFLDALPVYGAWRDLVHDLKQHQTIRAVRE
jgi:hypothetical protein